MLETIVLELLLEDVIFYSSWVNRFYSALESMASWTRNPGVLTRRATILFPDALYGDVAKNFAQLARLSEYCSKLRTITMFINWHGPGGSSQINLEWISNVTQAILQTPIFSTDCLVSLADKNPGLETLALIAERPKNVRVTLQTDVVFPQLGRFFISCDDVFCHLSTPKLEWLGFCLRQPSNPGLASFLRDNCTGLTYLHLDMLDLLDEDLPRILHLVYLCPSLETLSLEGYPVYNYGVDPLEPHPSLQHLVLRCEGAYEPVDWLEMFGLIHDGWRPLLSFTTITFRLFYRNRQGFTTFEKDKATVKEAIDERCGKLDAELAFEEVL
ncbi:hypothetical protein PIIN_05870 [Serendipita indica DSM 11827]|uniref:F-box domain-containing protein n=1 Tax=Serendipita indica (strain DSM 11827) TaxID=1109443 RepID=G4TKU2_SERID|nr:hypothetical protein PIIN_05870 [Serendipita indica DSM 11827]